MAKPVVGKAHIRSRLNATISLNPKLTGDVLKFGSNIDKMLPKWGEQYEPHRLYSPAELREFSKKYQIRIISPETTFISKGVTFQPGTIIYPFTNIIGNVNIGPDCTLGPFVFIGSNLNRPLTRVELGPRTTVTMFSSIEGAIETEADCVVGPVARLRDEGTMARGSKFGFLSEGSNFAMGENANAPHANGIYDANIGANVNVGGYSVFSNYDPVLKRNFKGRSVIGDNANIGARVTMEGPVVLGPYSLVASHTLVRKDTMTSPGSLVIGRPETTVKEAWVPKYLQGVLEKEGVPNPFIQSQIEAVKAAIQSEGAIVPV